MLQWLCGRNRVGLLPAHDTQHDTSYVIYDTISLRLSFKSSFPHSYLNFYKRISPSSNEDITPMWINVQSKGTQYCSPYNCTIRPTPRCQAPSPLQMQLWKGTPPARISSSYISQRLNSSHEGSYRTPNRLSTWDTARSRPLDPTI